MSKSLKRVTACLEAAGIDPDIRETALARSAADAAAALCCEVDQIAKSIVFVGETSGTALLFITAGSKTVDTDRASALAGEPLRKADAAMIRAQTGFAIGGVSPIGHLTAPRAWFDAGLLAFERIWAAAGTPHHVFGLAPERLCALSGALTADFNKAQ